MKCCSWLRAVLKMYLFNFFISFILSSGLLSASSFLSSFCVCIFFFQRRELKDEEWQESLSSSFIIFFSLYLLSLMNCIDNIRMTSIIELWCVDVLHN